SIDLHFWLSLRLAKDQAIFIAKALCEAFPERSEQIKNNLSVLEKKFEETDLMITEKLSPYEGQAILVSHPAFGYFCYDYKLKQISIEQEGKDPLPKDISSILTLAQSTPIRTVLTQAQYNNKGALMIAESLKLPVHEVDPYSANYLENLLYITHCVATP
ncbi:MAG: zinc ABC transporter substrate-binding protein, partial [Verrucomicrobia bacterium]|nr:zinc ABC transporter substrate-binding protein [Verrucomicrobiota bacterium]